MSEPAADSRDRIAADVGAIGHWCPVACDGHAAPARMVTLSIGRRCEDLRRMDTGTLADAIRQHRVVEMVYRGDREGSRVVHPHALYRTTTGGLCLDAVQVAGQTRSGRLPAWRQFHLMEIEDVRVLQSRFDVAHNFDPYSEKYRLGLIARV